MLRIIIMVCLFLYSLILIYKIRYTFKINKKEIQQKKEIQKEQIQENRILVHGLLSTVNMINKNLELIKHSDDIIEEKDKLKNPHNYYNNGGF